MAEPATTTEPDAALIIPVMIGADSIVMLPIHCLDAHPNNPKRFDKRKYGKPLEAFLRSVGLRSPLDAWPRPGHPGRYWVLDGNQRLPILRDNGVTSVPCIVHDDLDNTSATFYMAGKDRNHATYDEGKLADLVDSMLTAPGDGASMPDNVDSSLLAFILKPDRPFTPVVPGKPGVPNAPSAAPAPTLPVAPPTPTTDEPWGPPPPDTALRDDKPPAPSFIPVLISLSTECHTLVFGPDGLMKARNRLVRERRVRAMLALLDRSETGDDLTDDEVWEAMFRTLQARSDRVGAVAIDLGG